MSMTYQQIATLIGSVGAPNHIPYAYDHFTVDENNPGPPAPYITFRYVPKPFIADNNNYVRIEHLVIELFTDNKDYVHTAAMEAALAGAGLAYTVDETYNDAEALYVTTYEADFILAE